MQRIPRTFYDDHVLGRDLPAPPIIKEDRRHYWIDTLDANMAELIDDARFYADPDGPEGTWIKRAAVALLSALEVI